MKSEPVVYVVDDDDGVLKSLEVLITSIGMNYAGYASADAFLKAYDPNRAGCIVLDVRMPGMSGLELQKKINEYHIASPVIFITGHGDISMAVYSMKAGAFDFIEKPFREQVLLESIQRALDHDCCNRKKKMEQLAIDERLRSLTPREHQVLDMIIEGKPNKEIAYDLNLSPKTVEFHRSNVMDKMGAGSLAELVQMVVTTTTA